MSKRQSQSRLSLFFYAKIREDGKMSALAFLICLAALFASACRAIQGHRHKDYMEAIYQAIWTIVFLVMIYRFG